MSSLTLTRPVLKDHDPTRDKTYQQARSARAVTDWLAWLEIGGKAARTLDGYERDVARLLLMFPEKELEDFTAGDLLQCIKTWPVKGRRTRAVSINRFFLWCRKQRLIAENPADLLPEIKRQPQRITETFTDAEVATLCDIDGIDGALMLILFEAGLRKGEARRLRVRDTNLETETSFAMLQPSCQHEGEAIGVYGGGPTGRYTFENGAKDYYNRRGGYQGTIAEKREAMGIHWMTTTEINQAIPPAYTELIGHQLAQHLRATASEPYPVPAHGMADVQPP